MTTPALRSRKVARSLSWFSAGRDSTRSNIRASDQLAQQSSPFDTAYRDHVYSPMRRFTLAACARSYSPHSRTPAAALKSP